MSADYSDVLVEASGRQISVRLRVENHSQADWTRDGFSIGWQLFDPTNNLFIREGARTQLAQDARPGESVPVELNIEFPPEPGGYRIYVCPLDHARGWLYLHGSRFLVIDAEVSPGGAQVLKSELTTRAAQRRRSIRRALPRLFRQPFAVIGANHALIRSMVRRDVVARYRGSFGDVFWTVLNPLLLMLTYYFVFGVVLRTRFGADPSSAGFLLYFLAGMLPWLAFSEPAGRSANVVVEHHNFVKKLRFPLDILPVNLAASGLVTELFALGVFACFLIALRGHAPWTIAWLPAILIPQLLFTLGLCWFLAALGVFMRDLAQIMTFVLTVWFYVTPICYPEQSLASLPHPILAILGKNPMFALVRAYRAIFLEGRAPETRPLVLLWIVGFGMFLAGYAWFYKLKKTFADVI